MVRELLGVKDEAKFNKLYTRIEKYECISWASTRMPTTSTQHASR